MKFGCVGRTGSGITNQQIQDNGLYQEADPIGIQNGENHLYGYAGNNPVRFIDPRGLAPGETCWNLTVKRKNVDPFGRDKYGHWWIEYFGLESYGWWPKYPVSYEETLNGVEGELNGQTSFGGTSTRDPHHSQSADEVFHPKITCSTGCKSTTCIEAAQCVRRFAQSFRGRWQWPSGPNCHTFQEDMMGKCCLGK